MGTWLGTFKNYFSEVQKDITDMENTVEEEISFEKEPTKKIDNNKKPLR